MSKQEINAEVFLAKLKGMLPIRELHGIEHNPEVTHLMRFAEEIEILNESIRTRKSALWEYAATHSHMPEKNAMFSEFQIRELEKKLIEKRAQLSAQMHRMHEMVQRHGKLLNQRRISHTPKKPAPRRP